MTFSCPVNFNETCPTGTFSIRPASQTTFKYVLGVGLGVSGPGVTAPLPLPSSARGSIVCPASVAITVYGLEVTQVDNAKTTVMANARILFVFCFMSSDSFLQLSIFLG